jgi:hypothetical protein
MEGMAEPIVKIAHTVSRIAICDREIGPLNATSTSRFGYRHHNAAALSPASDRPSESDPASGVSG